MQQNAKHKFVAVDGVLLLDKPSGMSSNTALQRARRLLSAAKAGHTGTLDPLASGLLPLCLGEATKFSAGMLAADKTYDADIALGVTTTTGDAEGAVLSRKPVMCDQAGIDAVLPRFIGNILQTPPMYSALKRNGKPLYAYARAGETVAREPRPVVIYAIDVLAYPPAPTENSNDISGAPASNAPILRLRVHCGKGTYIRALAEDIGNALGCGASLQALRRTAVGALDIANAVTLDALENDTPQCRLARLLPVDSLIAELPRYDLTQAEAERLAYGQRCNAKAGIAPGNVRLYAPQQRFLGVGTVLPDATLVVRRLLATQ